jgi:hypothetical protein
MYAEPFLSFSPLPTRVLRYVSIHTPSLTVNGSGWYHIGKNRKRARESVAIPEDYFQAIPARFLRRIRPGLAVGSAHVATDVENLPATPGRFFLLDFRISAKYFRGIG